MQITLELPDIPDHGGFVYEWEDGFTIRTEIANGAIILSANKEGLISLARHLLSLSRDEFSNDYQLHLDSYNSLEEGSVELILQKK
jgi:hypothetical protein